MIEQQEKRIAKLEKEQRILQGLVELQTVKEGSRLSDGQGPLVRSLTARAKHRTLGDLLRSLNRVLRGWCNYFRHGVSSQTFSYLDHYTWWRIFG